MLLCPSRAQWDPGRDKPRAWEAKGLIQSLSEGAGFGARRKKGSLKEGQSKCESGHDLG